MSVRSTNQITSFIAFVVGVHHLKAKRKMLSSFRCYDSAAVLPLSSLIVSMGRVYTAECAVSGAFNGIPMMSCKEYNTEAQLACVAVQWAHRVFARPNSQLPLSLRTPATQAKAQLPFSCNTVNLVHAYAISTSIEKIFFFSLHVCLPHKDSHYIYIN